MAPTAGQQPARIPFSGYFTSATPTALSEANSRFTTKYRNEVTGDMAAIVLGADDFFEITDVSVISAAATIVTVYDGADATVDAGEQIAVVRNTTNVLQGHPQFLTPHRCTKATYPKVKGSVDTATEVLIHGYWNKF